MSIEVYVGFPTQSLDDLVDRVKLLPAPFSPLFFTRGERINSKLDRVDEPERFAAFYSRARKSSFGLAGDKIFFDFQPNVFRDERRNPLSGYLFISFKKGFSRIDIFSDLLVKLLEVPNVSFGYACQLEESTHRHRLKKHWADSKEGAASMEFTIGINYSEYIPGIYWKTAFGEAYLEQHDVDVEEISALAIETLTFTSELGNRFYIFKFYEDSKSWKDNIEKLEGFCVGHEQFFSMRRLKSKIDAAETEDELKTIVAPYW